MGRGRLADEHERAVVARDESASRMMGPAQCVSRPPTLCPVLNDCAKPLRATSRSVTPWAGEFHHTVCGRSAELRDDRLDALKLAALQLAGSEFLEQPLRHPVELLVDIGKLGGRAGFCEPHQFNEPK